MSLWSLAGGPSFHPVLSFGPWRGWGSLEKEGHRETSLQRPQGPGLLEEEDFQETGSEV